MSWPRILISRADVQQASPFIYSPYNFIETAVTFWPLCILYMQWQISSDICKWHGDPLVAWNITCTPAKHHCAPGNWINTQRTDLQSYLNVNTKGAVCLWLIIITRENFNPENEGEKNDAGHVRSSVHHQRVYYKLAEFIKCVESAWKEQREVKPREAAGEKILL